MGNEMYARARRAEEKITKKKFCTNCQKARPIDGGVVFKNGKIARWKCKTCAAREMERRNHANTRQDNQ
jgi:hypothetical protein